MTKTKMIGAVIALGFTVALTSCATQQKSEAPRDFGSDDIRGLRIPALGFEEKVSKIRYLSDGALCFTPLLTTDEVCVKVGAYLIVPVGN